MMKRILFFMRQSPYAGVAALETVESALVAGVFDLPVSVLFADQGVWQLVSGQDGSVLGARTLGKVLGALPEYGVSELYVCADSLAQRNLRAEDLVLPVRMISSAEIGALLSVQDVVVND